MAIVPSDGVNSRSFRGRGGCEAVGLLPGVASCPAEEVSAEPPPLRPCYGLDVAHQLPRARPAQTPAMPSSPAPLPRPGVTNPALPKRRPLSDPGPVAARESGLRERMGLGYRLRPAGRSEQRKPTSRPESVNERAGLELLIELATSEHEPPSRSLAYFDGRPGDLNLIQALHICRRRTGLDRSRNSYRLSIHMAAAAHSPTDRCQPMDGVSLSPERARINERYRKGPPAGSCRTNRRQRLRDRH